LVDKESLPCSSEKTLDWKDYSVLGALFASGFSIIFMSSPRFLGTLIGNFERITLYFAPLILVCLLTKFKPLISRSNRTPLLLISILLAVSCLNVGFSDNPERSKQAMFDFVCTGFIPFVAALFIFRNGKSLQLFDIFCSGCLALVVLVEVVAYIQRAMTSCPPFEIVFRSPSCLFVYFVMQLIGNVTPSWPLIGVIVRNPIPTGTLVILLSSGPLWLIASRNRLQVLLGSVLALSGASLILLTRKKGAFLAASLMFAVWAIVGRKKMALLVFPLLIALMLAATTLNRVDLGNIMDPSNRAHHSHLERMEWYPFAFHIFEKHPFLGTGLRSFTQKDYLSDYSPRNKDLKNFQEVTTKLQTFDDMYLTLFVEFGGIFSLFYFTLMAWICLRFYNAYQACPEGEKNRIYRVLPLLAFAFHSITYDSLMFEPINWLFHVQMGILASIDYQE
jgi:hypothetical protein